MSNCARTRWRYRENAFVNAKGELVSQRRVRLLKSKSCNMKCQPSNNCCESEYAQEYINEFIADSGELPGIPNDVRDGDELVVKFSGIDEIEEIWFEKAWI